jgi:hypothetical protein
MRRTLTLLILSGGLLLAPSALASPWGLDVEGGSYISWWFTSDDDDDEEYTGHAIDYEAEPASSWAAACALRYGNHDVFGLSITGPFGSAPEQEEVIEKTTSATTALQDYIAFLQLFGVVSPESTGFLKFLSGLRLDYRRLFFYGKGIAVEQAVFASRNSGLIALNVGDEFQYQANFEDWYLTLIRFGPVDRHLRLGLYRSVLEKPHETMEYAYDEGGNLVVETRLSGTGAFAQVGTDSWDFLLRVGQVDFEPQGEVDRSVYGGSGSFSMLMEFGWNPSIVLAGPPADGRYTLPRLALMPVVGLLFRADYLNPENGDAGSAEGELSMDILVDAGARVVWRF